MNYFVSYVYTFSDGSVGHGNMVFNASRFPTNSKDVTEIEAECKLVVSKVAYKEIKNLIIMNIIRLEN